MFQWNVEEMKLMNMPRENGIFACESEVSTEDKVSFVDQLQNGALTNILTLVKKLEADLPNLKKDEGGRVKTVSLQAWLRKNDHRHLVCSWSDCCGVIEFMGLKRNIRYINGVSCYRSPKSPTDFVDSCFHRQLTDCLIKERKYYNENNTDQKLIKEVCLSLNEYEYQQPVSFSFSIGDDISVRTNTSFDMNEWSIKLSYWESHEKDRDLTIEEVKALKSALAPVEKKYQQLLKAQAEMKQALKKAGTEFANVIMN